MSEPIFLSVEKTAETLGLSKEETYKLLNAGVLAGVRPLRADGTQMRKRLVKYTSVLEYAEACEQQPT